MEGLLSCQSPVIGAQHLRQKISRKPLQPRNFLVNPNDDQTTKNPKPKWIQISVADDSDKENRPITATTPPKIESLDASLAEELSAIRRKLERLRLEKEKTEDKLREKDLVLHMQMLDIQRKGEAQKQLEIMVEKFLALKKLQSTCKRITPIQSLREKEQEKKLKEMKSEEKECAVETKESVDKNPEMAPPADDQVPEKTPDL